MQYNKNIPGRILWHLFVHRGIWGIYSLNLLHNQSKICKLRSWSRSVSNDISIMNILHFLEQLVLVFFFLFTGLVLFCILVQLFNEYLFQKTTKICLMITRNYSNTGWMKEVVRFNKLFKMQTWQTHMGMKHSQMKI